MINGGIINTVAAAAEVCTTNNSSFPTSNLAYYKLDGDAIDSSGNGYNGTPSNITWGVGKFGPAAVFNGSSSVITSSSAGGAINVSNLSFSLWLNTNNTSTAHKVFLSQYDESGNSRFYFSLKDSGISVIVYGTSSAYTQNFPNIISTNQWYHIAITQTSTATKLYLNGQLQTASSSSGSPLNIKIASSPPALYFGQLQLYPGTFPFNGELDQVRIFNTVLTANQVTELYEDEIECCTTDEVNYPVTNLAYYQLNGGTGTTVVDETNTYDGTSSNVTYGAGLFNDAAVFNGSNSYTLTTNLKSQNVGTFSFWFKGSTPAGLATLFNNNFVSSNNKGVMIQGQSNGTIRVYISQGNGIGALDVYTTNTFFDNNWHNAVLTWDLNSTGTNTYLYIDNVVEASGAANTGVWTFGQDSTYGLFIGAGRTNIQFFNGSIDQARIFNTAITQGQVAELYQEKQCGCTTDTIDYPVTNTAYYQLNGDATDSSGNGYNGTWGGTEAYGAGKFDDAAVFNGSSKISLPNSIITGAFSLSFWVNTSNITTAKAVFNFENSTYRAESFIQNGLVYFRINSSGPTYFFLQSTLGDISINTWHNITYVFPNTTVTNGCKIYIDGQEAASGTSTAGGLNLTSTAQSIGARTNNTLYWLGKIDQVRIFNTAITAGQVADLYREIQC